MIPLDITPKYKLLVLDVQLDLGWQVKGHDYEVKRIKWWKLLMHKKQLVDAIGALNVDTQQLIEALYSNILGKIHATTIGKTKGMKRCN